MTTPAEYPDARPPGAGRIDPDELDAGRTDTGRIEPDRLGAGVEPNQPSGTGMDEPPYLVSGAVELTGRWQQAQATFVDDPREAVQEARQLVEDVLGRLTETFDEERERLEAAWVAGDEPSTEELRQALQRYRTFFDRLLAV